jgi:hypothetical protein
MGPSSENDLAKVPGAASAGEGISGPTLCGQPGTALE